jgi:hypothetical protein
VNLAGALNVDVYEFLRPQQTPTDDLSDFIKAYTEKAAKAASEAVVRSLDNLREQYIP